MDSEENLQPHTLIVEDDTMDVSESEWQRIYDDFETQRLDSSDVHPALAATMCGIVSFAMALKAHECAPSEIDMLEFARDFITMTNLTVPHTVIDMPLNGYEVAVPIVYDGMVGYRPPNGESQMWALDDTIPQALKPLKDRSTQMLCFLGLDSDVQAPRLVVPGEDAGKWTPGFSLVHGTDQRGFSHLIEKRGYPLKAELWEGDFNGIVERFNQDKGVCALVSVTHLKLGLPIDANYDFGDEEHRSRTDIRSHVVVLHGIYDYDGVPCVIVSDPAYTSKKDGVQIMILSSFEECYGGHATFLTHK